MHFLLNFNKNNLYEFYEWEDNDYFDYVKKIEVIKVSKDTIKDIIKNQIMRCMRMSNIEIKMDFVKEAKKLI